MNRDDRAKYKSADLARKRALIRSLVEQSERAGLVATSATEASNDLGEQPESKIILFPTVQASNGPTDRVT